MLYESPMPDWWLTGPRTSLWLCRFWVDNQGDPMAWFAHFLSTGKLTLRDGGMEDLERCCRCFYSGVCFDQMNVPDLSSFEVMARNIQVTAESYKHRFPGASNDDTEKQLMYGTDQVRGGLPMCPALRAHIATELTRINAIEKERRKAREERQAQNPAPKKGDGKKGQENL